MEETFDLIRGTIETLTNSRKRAQVINWLRDLCKYIIFEPKFKPQSLRKYSYGELLDVNFGYNIGAELNGPHFAVVVEDNGRSNGTIVVIPLSSYRLSEPKIQSSEVDLGVIEELNQYRKSVEVKGSKAKIGQIRSISKMRIYYPKRTAESLGILTEEQLKLLKKAINSRFVAME